MFRPAAMHTYTHSWKVTHTSAHKTYATHTKICTYTQTHAHTNTGSLESEAEPDLCSLSLPSTFPQSGLGVTHTHTHSLSLSFHPYSQWAAAGLWGNIEWISIKQLKQTVRLSASSFLWSLNIHTDVHIPENTMLLYRPRNLRVLCKWETFENINGYISQRGHWKHHFWVCFYGNECPGFHYIRNAYMQQRHMCLICSSTLTW